MRLLIPAAVMLVYACGASTPEPASAPTPALDSGSRVEDPRSEEHTSELQSRLHLVCRLLLEKKKKRNTQAKIPPAHRVHPREAQPEPLSPCQRVGRSPRRPSALPLLRKKSRPDGPHRDRDHH